MNIMDMLKKPVVIAVLALMVGIALGLTWGWVIQPTTFIDAPINLLRNDLKENYLRMTLDSLRVNGEMGLAISRYQELGANAPEILAAIKANPAQTDPAVVAVFEQVLIESNALTPNGATPSGSDSGGGNNILTIGIILASLVVLGAVAVAVFWLFRSNRRAPEDMTPAMLAAEHSRSVEKTDYSTSGQEPPVAQYVTTYVLGDDLFDDSFSIDAPSGEFLGECGVGISETIGVGDPKKVAAFEIWMFDKNDIQTVTKVLMSPHAFADPTFRAKLEPKGELIQVDPRKKVVLETQTLQMTATISDMQYGQGALPDGSYFDRVTIELAIWSKK